MVNVIDEGTYVYAKLYNNILIKLIKILGRFDLIDQEWHDIKETMLFSHKDW